MILKFRLSPSTAPINLSASINMLKTITYTGLEAGPTFLIVGAIHGNEKCGTTACHRVMAEIDEGVLQITRGKVIFVPIGNPRAYQLDKRFVERNLNRYLVPMDNPNCYEAQLGNILCPLLQECDAHLSIHSYTVGGDPFIFVSPDNKQEHQLANCLGPWTLLTGWQEAYAATSPKSKQCDDEEATGSVEYARRYGALAINIECGQHKDPHAPDVAYQAIRNALRYLGHTSELPLPRPQQSPRIVTVTHVIYRDDMGTFTKPWKHLERVAKDEIIAFNVKGDPLLSPSNGFIIMPKADSPIGEEWYYIGVEKAIEA